MPDVVFRLECWFAQQVQRVGFCYQTVTLAMGFDVSGTVQNLPDLRVYLPAEGVESKVSKFQKEVQSEWKHYNYFSQLKSSLSARSTSGFRNIN